MATAATLISTAVGVAQQRKSNKQQEKADKIQQRAAELRNAKSRRASIGQARRLRAQTVAQGQAQGVGGGSSASQAAGSVVTQSAANIGFSRALESADRSRASAIRSANRAAGNAQTAFSLSNSGFFEGAESLLRDFSN